MTELITNLNEWSLKRLTFSDKTTLGLVPTMGNLHRGHLSLIQRSMNENDISIVSFFVNLTQFNKREDFENYPKTMQNDLALCEAAGVDYFFLPTYESMYPDGYRYKIKQEKTHIMEAKYRPKHFEGMLTIILKLLLLIKPHKAYFGEKDYQQFELVRDMAEAFFLDTDIIACATVREDDSHLALSSRNVRLTKDQLSTANYFPKYLHSDHSCEEIILALQSKGFKVEYIQEHEGRRYGAVRLGNIRLIDNIKR